MFSLSVVMMTESRTASSGASATEVVAEISAQAALQALCSRFASEGVDLQDYNEKLSGPELKGWIDVRSPGEFLEGNIPGFVNLPILTDTERHEVGIAYKHLGKQQAIEMGQRLVSEDQRRRILSWKKHSHSELPTYFSCWRGGLRSRTALKWFQEEVGSTSPSQTVRGGYKALRKELLLQFAQLPPLLVLTGLTGSRKTKLLLDLPVPRLDLEGMARHRGSSFGRRLSGGQPSQTTFENRLALALLSYAVRLSSETSLLVEAESAFIGRICLPTVFKEKMKQSTVIVLEAPLHERSEHIFREYVCEPLTSGVSAESLLMSLESSLERIRSKLGGQMTDQVLKELRDAFQGDLLLDLAKHSLWIEKLLLNYYDKQYLYTFEKNESPVLFKGDYLACRQWILTQFNSPKP